MAANLSTIQLIENHEQWQQLYKILAEANPANQSIQRELGKLSNNKDTYVAQLKLACVKLTSMQLVSESTAATSVPLDVIFKLENVDC